MRHLNMINSPEIDTSISDNDFDIIEKETRSQSKGNAFFRHKTCRIGASVSKQASHTNPSQPSQSLIKSICYPDLFKFHAVASDYGCMMRLKRKHPYY